MHSSLHAFSSKDKPMRPLLYSAYFLILISLIVSGILDIFYRYTPTKSQKKESHRIETSNFTAVEVACAFPASGQYSITAQTTFYVLLILTVTLRQQPWIAAGIAASALTYSGVAAIHIIVLFVAYNRAAPSSLRSACREWEINIASAQAITGSHSNHSVAKISICTGAYEPDVCMATVIVGASLLAALPMAMWSTTFRSAAARPILLLWTLLLAVSHVLYNVIVSDNHRHYQICPNGIVEPFPGRAYIAGSLNMHWENKVRGIVEGVDYLAASEERCVYSCFASGSHIGRHASEIGIFPFTMLDSDRGARHRGVALTFWLLYACFAVTALITEKGQWSQRSSAHVLGRRFLQLSGVMAYLGFLGFSGNLLWFTPQSEGFDSIGQWSIVATVLLVAVATLIGKIVDALQTPPKETCITWDDGANSWSCDIGYAS